MQETFTIKADITGSGTAADLDVYQTDSVYTIVFDGITLTTIEYDLETFPHWKQIEGNLDQQTISLIGDQIEYKFG